MHVYISLSELKKCKSRLYYLNSMQSLCILTLKDKQIVPQLATYL